MISVIGSTGLVGSHINSLFPVDKNYNSKNIADFKKTEHDLVFCCAPSSVKWVANKNPAQDLESVSKLISNIDGAKAKKIYLFSTIDMYGKTLGQNEDSTIDIKQTSAYGRNRYLLETYLCENFDTTTIRLPALFGEGLKKNVIFDLNNNNQIEKISLNTTFQWFYLPRLADIVSFATDRDIRVLNVATEPIKTVKIVEKHFPELKNRCLGQYNVRYDFKTIYNETGYLYDKETVMNDLEEYLNETNSN